MGLRGGGGGGGVGPLLLGLLAAGVTANAPAYKVNKCASCKNGGWGDSGVHCAHTVPKLV